MRRVHIKPFESRDELIEHLLELTRAVGASDGAEIADMVRPALLSLCQYVVNPDGMRHTGYFMLSGGLPAAAPADAAPGKLYTVEES